MSAVHIAFIVWTFVCICSGALLGLAIANLMQTIIDRKMKP